MTKYIRLSVTPTLHTYFRPSHSHSHCLGTAQASNPSRYHSRTSRTLVPCMLSLSPTNPLSSGGGNVLGSPVSYGGKVRLSQCCLHGMQSMPRKHRDRSRPTACCGYLLCSIAMYFFVFDVTSCMHMASIDVQSWPLAVTVENAVCNLKATNISCPWRGHSSEKMNKSSCVVYCFESDYLCIFLYLW